MIGSRDVGTTGAKFMFANDPSRMARRLRTYRVPLRRIYATLLCSALIPSAACKRQALPGGNRPPPTVTVARPVERNVIEWDEYTGRLEAVDFVEVRARVSGLIVSVPFTEGSLVGQGDLLFEIDVRPFQAALDQALAAEAEAEAQVDFANIEFSRLQNIPKTARSATELDRADATLQRAKAVLAGAQAQVATARLNVEWCRVTAPIAGRVSRKLVTEGNLITGGGGQTTLLTTIISIDPIYCYVDTDEQSVLKYARLARSGERVSARQARIPCVMQLADEAGYPHVGEVDFVDTQLDPMTGTIQGRGRFPNPDGWMLPGLYARVRIPGSGRYDATLVPDSAVMTDQNEKVLLIVDDKKVVQPRQVTLGALFGDLRAIESGVTTSDLVIINGLMRARPGTIVNTVDGTISLESLPAGMEQMFAPEIAPTATRPADPADEERP